VQVKPDDNVEVGHVVASISDSDAAAPAPADAEAPAAPKAEPPAEKPAKAPKPKKAAAAAPPPKPAASAPAPEQPPAAAAHRTPSIRFPPRRTPDGELISALPRSEAQSLLAQLLGGGDGEAAAAAGGAAAVPQIPDEYRDMIAVPIVGGSMPILRGPPVPAGPPGPPRRTMSDREMEAIMLGGADP
jgi:pyruvate/2-oxoglutarate dehydrogenase complex dihydrolipoamide acyltransferase (E2) component